MSLSTRLLFLTSAFSAAACAAAHVLTFADIAFYPVLLFVPVLFVALPLVIWKWRRVPRKNLVSEIFGDIPRWMKVSAALLFVYVFANFFLCSALNQFGTPTREENRFVLKNKGKVVRELTPGEFKHAQAVEVRMLTGHLFALFGLSALALRAVWIKSSTAMAGARVD